MYKCSTFFGQGTLQLHLYLWIRNPTSCPPELICKLQKVCLGLPGLTSSCAPWPSHGMMTVYEHAGHAWTHELLKCSKWKSPIAPTLRPTRRSRADLTFQWPQVTLRRSAPASIHLHVLTKQNSLLAYTMEIRSRCANMYQWGNAPLIHKCLLYQDWSTVNAIPLCNAAYRL